MDTFSYINRLLDGTLDKDAHQCVDRPTTTGPVEPAIEEPDFTDPEVNPFARLLTADELQTMTSVKKTWWLAEARADRIPHLRLGKYVRFEFYTVIQFLRERSADRRLQRQ